MESCIDARNLSLYLIGAEMPSAIRGSIRGSVRNTGAEVALRNTDDRRIPATGIIFPLGILSQLEHRSLIRLGSTSAKRFADGCGRLQGQFIKPPK